MKKLIFFVPIVIFNLILLSCQDDHSSLNSISESNKVRVDDMLLDQSSIKNVVVTQGISTQAAGGYGVYGSQPWNKGIMPLAFSQTVTHLA